MNIYKWEGKGHYLGAVVIVVADSIKGAKELIEKELIDTGLGKSWEETQELTVYPTNTYRIVYVDNGDY